MREVPGAPRRDPGVSSAKDKKLWKAVEGDGDYLQCLDDFPTVALKWEVLTLPQSHQYRLKGVDMEEKFELRLLNLTTQMDWKDIPEGQYMVPIRPPIAENYKVAKDNKKLAAAKSKAGKKAAAGGSQAGLIGPGGVAQNESDWKLACPHIFA